MLAHCVNPDCGVALRSFSEGRLFQFEVVSISVAASDETGLPFDEKPKRQTSHFWLCGNCSAQMSIRMEPALGLKLIPLGCGDKESAEAGHVSQNNSRVRQPNPS